jgi:hypothetical protein
MQTKFNTTYVYITGIVILLLAVVYGLYYKINDGIEFQASLAEIAAEVKTNKTDASAKIKAASKAHQTFLDTVSGDFDSFYMQEFNKNQFVRTFDKIIDSIATEQDPLIVTNLSFSNPIPNTNLGFESIPVALTLTSTKDSLMILLEEFEKVGLSRVEPFYLIELKSLNFRVPNSSSTEANPEFQTTLNLNILKTIQN